MNQNKILAVDPSGTGTTGMFFKNGTQEQFISCQNPDWKKHYDFIAGMVKVYHPDILLYEHTNFISLRGKDMTSLLKLLGTMETLSLPCSVLRTETIPVDQVKRLRGKLLKGEQTIKGLEYQPGKGWHHNGKKISVHGLDAYLVYWLWNDKQNNKPIDKTMSATKSKAKSKQIDIEEELPEDIGDLPIPECVEIRDDFPEEEPEDHE